MPCGGPSGCKTWNLKEIFAEFASKLCYAVPILVRDSMSQHMERQW